LLMYPMRLALVLISLSRQNNGNYFG